MLAVVTQGELEPGGDACGQRRAASGGQVFETGARDLDAPGRTQHDVGAVAPERHHRHFVAALVGVEEQAEDRALHRLHTALDTHRARGVHREHDQVPGFALADRFANVLDVDGRRSPSGRRPHRGSHRKRRHRPLGDPVTDEAAPRSFDGRAPAAHVAAMRRQRHHPAGGLLGPRHPVGCGLAVEGLVDLLLADPRLLERRPAPPMGQGERRHPADVVLRRLRSPFPARERGGAAADHQVGSQSLGPHRRTQAADRLQQVGWELRRAGCRQARPQVALVERRRQLGRVVVEGQPAADRFGALLRLDGGQDVDGEAEAVQQLGPEVALLGIHGAGQHEAAGVDLGDPLSLHLVEAAGGHVEQHVDQVVGQQIHLVDVEHAAVGSRQQARLEAAAALGERSFDVEGAHQPVLGGADRQFDERRIVREERGETARQRGLRAAFLATEKDATDGRVDGVQEERQLGVLLADNGAERESPPCRCRRHRDSSHPSASSRACRSVDRASSDASHKPRCSASSRRSAIDRIAHGLDSSKNFRVAGSPT